MSQSVIDSEYDQALQAAMQHKERHCKAPKKPPTKKWVFEKEKTGGGLSLRRIRLKPKGAPQRNAFGSGSAANTYGGGEESRFPAATSYSLSPSPAALSWDSDKDGDRDGDGDVEYERALAEAMRAGQMDANNTKRNPTNRTSRSFLKRLRKRSSRGGGGPSFAGPHEQQQQQQQRQWGCGSGPAVSGFSSEQTADEAARQQAERHEAYLRVLNKDKELVSGTYTEAGVQVSVLAGTHRDRSVAVDAAEDLIDFKFFEAVAPTPATPTSASSSPVSTCSRDTSINSVNASFDLLGWDGVASESESAAAHGHPQKGHALVNPFDVFAPAAP